MNKLIEAFETLEQLFLKQKPFTKKVVLSLPVGAILTTKWKDSGNKVGVLLSKPVDAVGKIKLVVWFPPSIDTDYQDVSVTVLSNQVVKSERKLAIFEGDVINLPL